MQKCQQVRSGILVRMELPARDSELVRIMDAGLAEAARKAGAWLACRPGCTQCCHGTFAIDELDAQRLHAGMERLRKDNPALAATIEQRAEAWIAEHGADFPGDPRTGLLGESDEERERFEEYANEAACPALDGATGLCDVYAWRPMTCRVFGPPVRSAGPEGEQGLGHCELCFAGATEEQVAACEMPVPAELEQKILEELEPAGETIVAFALLRRSR
jgi:Fe-S-cluster containining protein